jgi:hypothetical protein
MPCKCKHGCATGYCVCNRANKGCSPDCGCGPECRNVEGDIHAARRRGRQVTRWVERDAQRSCWCKKNQCLKLYCVCLQAGSRCSLRCRCSACRNTMESGGKDLTENSASSAVEKSVENSAQTSTAKSWGASNGAGEETGSGVSLESPASPDTPSSTHPLPNPTRHTAKEVEHTVRPPQASQHQGSIQTRKHLLWDLQHTLIQFPSTDLPPLFPECTVAEMELFVGSVPALQ